MARKSSSSSGRVNVPFKGASYRGATMGQRSFRGKRRMKRR